MAIEGQGYPCYQHDMMMMMMKDRFDISNRVLYPQVFFKKVNK